MLGYSGESLGSASSSKWEITVLTKTKIQPMNAVTCTMPIATRKSGGKAEPSPPATKASAANPTEKLVATSHASDTLIARRLFCSRRLLLTMVSLEVAVFPIVWTPNCIVQPRAGYCSIGLVHSFRIVLKRYTYNSTKAIKSQSLMLCHPRSTPTSLSRYHLHLSRKSLPHRYQFRVRARCYRQFHLGASLMRGVNCRGQPR